MTITEQQLWFFLDTIAVRESAMGGNRAKSDAAVAMMRHLYRPNHAECRSMYKQGYEVALPDGRPVAAFDDISKAE